MGSKNRKKAAKQAETAAPAEQAAQPAAPAGKVLYCNVKAGAKYRMNRDAWYQRILAFNGKPVAELVADLEKNRPSVYGAKSMHSGKPEPVRGWVRFFEREGVLTYSDQEPAAQ
jgi:hypothetical protein